MTSSSHPRRTRRWNQLASGAAVVAVGLALVVGPASSAGAKQAGLIWTVSWKAPVTSAGPNRFDEPATLVGTAAYTLGPITRVDYTLGAPQGLPAACGTFPAVGTATLNGGTFTIKPNLACNGTYAVTAIAQSGTGMLAAHSPKLQAPVSLADPGVPVSGLNGVVQGSTRAVTLSWTTDPDPDVVGYRVRRNGVAVGDVAPDVRIHTDVAPSDGTFTYDVVTLRWGAGGPTSTPIASPPTPPLVARVVPDAPPATIGSGSGGSGSGGSGSSGSGSSSGSSGSSSGSAGSKGSSTSSHHGTPPKAGRATAHLPNGGSATAGVPSRKGYRSGGTVDPNVPTTTLDDGFQARLPYEAGTSRSKVELADPSRTEAVSRTVSVPKHSKPGLLVPIAIVLVLLAGAMQVRALLGRAGAAGVGVDGDPLAP